MHRCCTEGEPDPRPDPSPAPPPRGATRAGRIAALIQWALPITTLALIPKCPACVAAYILLFTGVGLSFSAAAAVRSSLIALSIAALTYLLFRTARRALASQA